MAKLKPPPEFLKNRFLSFSVGFSKPYNDVPSVSLEKES